jgi:signal peptidase
LSSSISNARQSIAQVLNFALVLSTAFMMVGPHHIPSTDGA